MSEIMRYQLNRKIYLFPYTPTNYLYIILSTELHSTPPQPTRSFVLSAE